MTNKTISQLPAATEPVLVSDKIIVARNATDLTQTTIDKLPAVTTTTNGVMVAADKVKLNGIPSNATANDTDANLKNRANHTGTQTASTISDFNAAVDTRINGYKGYSNVATSRNLAQTDDEKTLVCTASGVDLTVVTGLVNFGCAISKNGVTRVLSTGGVLLNGATDPVTINAAMGAIVQIGTNSFNVVGT